MERARAFPAELSMEVLGPPNIKSPPPPSLIQGILFLHMTMRTSALVHLPVRTKNFCARERRFGLEIQANSAPNPLNLLPDMGFRV